MTPMGRTFLRSTNVESGPKRSKLPPDPRHHQALGTTIESYLLIKSLHILSATVLFGTGLGIAFFFWSARQSDDHARLFAARTTVRADFLFTLPAVILQPLTGLWLISDGGIDPR